MELGMWGAVDMDREAIAGDDVLASARGVDAGCKAIDGDDILAGAHVVRSEEHTSELQSQ